MVDRLDRFLLEASVSDPVLSAPALTARTRRALDCLRALTQASDPVRAEVVDSWIALLTPTLARLRREATQVGLVGHQPGDLARAATVLFEADLLPSNADETPGRLLRIVTTRGEPELEEHTPHDSPWHWSAAHPDPVPPMLAKATGLQAERAALTQEDQDTSQASARLKQRVSQLQQDVLALSSGVREVRSAERTAARQLDEAERRLADAIHRRNQLRGQLPDALHPDATPGAVQAFEAAVHAPFHPNTLDELAQEDDRVQAARAEVARRRTDWDAAEACLREAVAHQNAHDELLKTARAEHATAVQRRLVLRDRANALSRKRLTLAQQMDEAAELRRATLTDDLAARLHGDSTGRLRLRWPHGGLGEATICLVSPGTLTDDDATRQLAEDILTRRADVLLVGAQLGQEPSQKRVRSLQRMSRSCPRIALVFHDLQPGQEEARRTARNRWADALQIDRERLLAVAIHGDAMTGSPSKATAALRAGRRERAALAEAVRTGPPVARAAGIAQALRSAAGRIDAELHRLAHALSTQMHLLEAQRIDDISSFVAERLEEVARHIAPAAQRARESIRRTVSEHLHRTRTALAKELQQAPDNATLTRLCDELPDRLAADVSALPLLRAPRRAEVRAVEELVDIAMQPLCERIRLTAQATHPPEQADGRVLEEGPLPETILDRLRDGLDGDTTATRPAAVAGGAIGAAVLGPLGALIGAGAGVLVSKVGSRGRRSRAAVQLLEECMDDLQDHLIQQSIGHLDGCELRIGTRVGSLLPRTLERYVEWWSEQRDDLRRQQARLQQKTARLEKARGQLLASSAELEAAIASQTGLAGVFYAPPHRLSLPPPPPALG